MTEEKKIFFSTIAGEGINSSPTAWRLIASSIMNRVPGPGKHKNEWSKWKTPLAVIVNTGFDAFTQQNPPYLSAMKALEKWESIDPNSRLAHLIKVVDPLFEGKELTIPGVVLYFSPKAQQKLHETRPDVYRRTVPHWAESPLVEEVKVVGLLETDDFRFFRYKVTV